MFLCISWQSSHLPVAFKHGIISCVQKQSVDNIFAGRVPSAWLFSVLVAVSNAVCREHSLQICGLLLHTLSSLTTLSLVVPGEQSFGFWMFNRREVLACLFSYVSSWLQFDRIKPNCRLASQLVYSLFQHSCSLFSPSFCWQYESWKKQEKWKKIQEYFFFKSSVPCRVSSLLSL